MEVHKRTRQPPMSRADLVVALYGALSLTAILISAGREDIDIYRIAGTSTPLRLLVSPFLGVLVGLLVVALSRLASRYFEWSRKLHQDFHNLLGPLSGKEIFILAVASAVGEELLFRGALLPWIGLWPQAVIFALLHIGPSARFLPWTASAFAIGVWFGYLFQWTGDLGAPMVAHFVINFLNMSYITRVDLVSPDSAGEPGAGEDPSSPTTSPAR